MSNGEPSKSLDALIQAVVNKQKYNQQRLGREAGAYAARLAKVFGPDLTEDQREEVFTQAFVELLQAGPEALAKYGGVRLFRRCVRAAVRAVRASYAPPGRRTRSLKGGVAPAGKIAAEDATRIVSPLVLARISLDVEGAAQSPDPDQLADPASLQPFVTVENDHDVHALLRQASTEMAWALRRIHLEAVAVDEVATDLRLNRFALNRRFKAFFQTCRAAA